MRELIYKCGLHSLLDCLKFGLRIQSFSLVHKNKHTYIYLYILIYTDLKLKCICICIYTHIYTSLHTYSFSHICFPYFINLSMVDFNFNVKKLRHLKIDNYKKYYKLKIAFGFYEDKDLKAIQCKAAVEIFKFCTTMNIFNHRI